MKSARQQVLDIQILRNAMRGPYVDQRRHTARAGWAMLALAVIALAALLALGGCTTAKKLAALDATSATIAAAKPLITEQCDKEKRTCIEAIKSGAATQPTCPKLKDCEVAEKAIYTSVGAAQALCEVAGKLIKADDPAVQTIMAEVLRRLGLIRDALKLWGVTL